MLDQTTIIAELRRYAELADGDGCPHEAQVNRAAVDEIKRLQAVVNQLPKYTETTWEELTERLEGWDGEKWCPVYVTDEANRVAWLEITKSHRASFDLKTVRLRQNRP